MIQGKGPESKNAADEWRGEKSGKRLRCSLEVGPHMKQYVQSIKERVAQGQPFVFGDGTTPLYFSMDIIQIIQVYYSSLIAAKQLSPYYFDRLNQEGYSRNLCRYCTAALGYAFDKKNDIAPWGGLPKPNAVVGAHGCDPLTKIMALYAREFDCPFFFIDYSRYPDSIPRGGWMECITNGKSQPHRLNLLADEYRALVSFLENTTGAKYSATRLRQVMELANQMFEYYWKAHDLSCFTVPAPITITDSYAHVPAMMWQWGTQWGVDAARKYYEEIKERVDNGIAAVQNERIRLLWRYAQPVWFTLGFYNHWEESHGAIFVPKNYVDGAAGFIERDIGEDPILALADQLQRTIDAVGVPTLMVQWALLAKEYKADGVIFMPCESCKLIFNTATLAAKALERAGIPTLTITADMLDARDWDDVKMKSVVTSFIETLSE